MPIIINSKSCCDAGWWTDHLKKTETNERVEVIGFYGLSAETMEDAFSEMQAMARASRRTTNFFSQYNINPRADEHLTEAQWQEAHELHRQNHGLDHLPYFRVRHIKEGRVHEHGIALRVDPETGKAIPDSLTAPINERTSRELEVRFDLERGRSILTRDREVERPERRPKKRETFRAAESGIDVETVKADARAAKEQADNGHSFKAALEASGDYVLARGDRRDFVIIDRTGDEHSLGRRLGVKASEMRLFMADLDPATLPGVEQAKALQAERHQAPEITQEPPQQPAAEERSRYDQLREAGREAQREQGDYGVLFEAARAAKEAQQQAEGAAPVEKEGAPAEAHQASSRGAERPLSRVQGEIRMALNLTQSGQGFADAIEDRGFMLCEVRAPEIQRRNRHELEALLEAKANGVWMLAEDSLTLEQTASARTSYEAWLEKHPPDDDRKPLGFEGYVIYVQVKQQERLAQLQQAAEAAPPRDEAEDKAPLLPTYAKAGDLVVVDGRGSIYSLNQRTTGKDKDELAHYLGTVDRAELMSVTDAQAVVREVKEDRKTERAHARTEEPVGKTAGDIRMAWVLARDPDPAQDAERLTDALAARGMAIAQVSAPEAYASERASALAKEVGNYKPLLIEGELVVVTGFGSVYRLDERTTGSMRPEIDARLAGIDRAPLMDVGATQEAMREASLEAWKTERRAEREAARDASWIENRIGLCAMDAPAAAVVDQEGHIVSPVSALLDQLKKEEEREYRSAEVHGADAFAARLAAAGIALCRVTPEDELKIAELRKESELGATVAMAEATTNTAARRFDYVLPGDLAAVTREGDVYLVNPAKLGDAALFIPEALPRVIETRDRLAAERQDMRTIWEVKRAEVAAEQQQREGNRELHGTVFAAERAVHNAFETPAAALDDGLRMTGKLASAAEKVVEFAVGLFGGFMAPPKDTPAQAEQKEKAATNEETLHAQGYAASMQAKEAEYDDHAHAQKTADQYQDLMASKRTGRTPTREANVGRERERDDDYERERER